MNFLVFEKDSRMDYAANQLYSLGCEIIKDGNNIPNKSIALLPPPVSKAHYELIKPYLNTISCIYGGAISEEFLLAIKGLVPVIDYFSFPKLVWENALLTAKGIIKEALLKLENLENKNVLITGYGYCGKAIALELKKFNCNIYVAIRNHKLKGVIEAENYSFVELKHLGSSSNNVFDCVFNTIPAKIITSQVIDNFNDRIVIYDIASKPGGVDFEYCKQKGIFATLSLGIPGRYYPKEAGILIGNACYNHYINNFH